MPVTLYYLELAAGQPFEIIEPPQKNLHFEKISDKSGLRRRSLYQLIGGDVEKLGWTADEWDDWASNPYLHSFEVRQNSLSIAYFDLLEDPWSKSVEIVFFGVEKRCHGRRLGAWLLSEALQYAQSIQAVKIHTHTCSTDHPAALQNYLKRGMKLVREESV